jgi:peptidoglycan/LPS O-acetylase OafA/YrhL
VPTARSSTARCARFTPFTIATTSSVLESPKESRTDLRTSQLDTSGFRCGTGTNEFYIPFAMLPSATCARLISSSTATRLVAAVLMSALAQPTWPIAVIARTRLLAEIGRVSYCLYLLHDAVRIGGGFLLKNLVPNTPSWEFVATNAAAAVISYLIARLSWIYFEHPLLRRGHEFKY